jgi:hypothetical protein
VGGTEHTLLDGDDRNYPNRPKTSARDNVILQESY